MKNGFSRYALAASDFVGGDVAFFGACALILVWAAAGPFLHFSEAWQLTVNTGTSIVTFLIVFLIQHAQDRDTRSIRLKLDELLRVIEGTRPALFDLDLSEKEIEDLERQFKDWRKRAESESGRQREVG